MQEAGMYSHTGVLLRVLSAVIHLEKDLQHSPLGLSRQIASIKTIDT